MTNETSSYGLRSTSTPKSYVSPFQVSPTGDTANASESDHSTNEVSPFVGSGRKGGPGRKRKADKAVSPIEAPTSPRKSMSSS